MHREAAREHRRDRPDAGRVGCRLPRRDTQSAFGRFMQAILHNRKATGGSVILLILVFVAIFPGAHRRATIPRRPSTVRTWVRRRSISLGTTQLGQDVFSQLIWGTRLTLIVTVVVSAIATLISMIIGVTAAYVGGADRSVLSLLTDIFLIIPTLPLLIVLASYLPPGSVTMIVVLTLTELGVPGSAAAVAGTLAACP